MYVGALVALRLSAVNWLQECFRSLHAAAAGNKPRTAIPLVTSFFGLPAATPVNQFDRPHNDEVVTPEMETKTNKKTTARKLTKVDLLRLEPP